MPDLLIDRRTLLLGSASLLTPKSLLRVCPIQTKPLTTSPARVFWAEETKSPIQAATCFFVVILPSKAGGKITRGTVTLSAKGETVKEEKLSAEFLSVCGFEVAGSDSLYVMLRVSEPKPLSIDVIRVELWQDSVHWSLDVKPQWYETKTKLIFPFKGKGIVNQGWFNDNGHANGSSQFALDVLALNETYGPTVDDEDKNESYAGFGHEIIAPGDGVVVAQENSIPNQPKPGTMDPSTFTLPSGRQISQGNHIVIDHENGEFSVLMHMQPDSILVKKGDRVTRGQPVGKLGNAGNSYGPHIHYQLQDGISFATSSGLPCKFENVSKPLVRGQYITAK